MRKIVIDPRVIKHLGRDLITSPEVAIIELIKNSIDAKASHINLRLYNSMPSNELMLIERDYRGIKATLAYNGLPFSVPKNLYIIGMMNTADRSLAMIDYALRRRFSFFEIEPGFDSEGFIHYQNGLNNETLNELVSKVKELNREIAADKSLGKGFCIGHSYFCGKDVCTDEWLHSIVDYDILPMLSEYWFDDTSKLRRWENILQGMFQ